MKKSPLLVAAGFLSALLGFSTGLSSEADNTSGQGPRKPVTNDHAVPFLIDRGFGYYQNNGKRSYNPFTANSGFEFPKGDDSTLFGYAAAKTLVFCDGILWGGFHRGMLRVGGSHCNSALQVRKMMPVR